MAFWTTGWEDGATALYTSMGWTFTGTAGVVSTAGQVHKSLQNRGGTYSLNVDDGARSPVFGTGGRWLHFWWHPQTAGTSFLGVQFNREATAQASVNFTVGGNVTIRRGGVVAGAIIGSGAFNPSVDHWVAIEAQLENSPTGNMRVYIDGVLVASALATDTQNHSVADWDQIDFNANNQTCNVDDIIVTTTAEGRLGEHFLPPMIPTGNDVIGSGAGSTGGSGTFANVDEIPPDGATSFNEFTATGTDRYSTANLGFTPASIHCVTITNQAARDGTIISAQVVCATDTGGGGATEALGTATGLGASGVYVPWQSTFNVDPDTAAAWTSAGLDDLRIGVKFST
jgi:hypothetical protein